VRLLLLGAVFMPSCVLPFSLSRALLRRPGVHNPLRRLRLCAKAERAQVIQDVALAGRLLRAGSLVAFPTETVYGLGASVWNETAAADIFRVKGRPRTDPLIVHVLGLEEARAVLAGGEPWEDAVVSTLAGRFWPGPLTLVARGSTKVPDCVSAGTGMVGVRCPAHPLALRLLKEAGVPLVAPSANR
jgi:L-threonylcarbamoyladenylate synthase